MLRPGLAGKISATRLKRGDRHMRFTRAAFGAGIAIGFIAGSRAGREQYDRMVKYSRMAVNSPPVQRAGHAISAKAADMAKSAGTKASKTADDAGKKTRDRVAKGKVPETGA